MRAVVDPAIFAVALLAPRGSSAQVVRAGLTGGFELVTSPHLVDEIEALLDRPALRALLPEGHRRALVDLVRAESTLLGDGEAPPVSEDPGDDYLLALARSVSARVIVSRDPHLEQLADRLPIVSPSEFLVLVGP